MARRSEMLAVVVGCDDGELRERVATALRAQDGVTVVAATDTVRVGSAVTRLRPDAVVVVSPRPRHVDMGRIGTLTRDRSKRAPVLVLLVDDPEAADERARAAGAALVAAVPGADAGDLVTELRRLCGP